MIPRYQATKALWAVVGLLAAVVSAPALADEDNEIGRYEFGGPGETILLDTKTGQTWGLTSDGGRHWEPMEFHFGESRLYAPLDLAWKREPSFDHLFDDLPLDYTGLEFRNVSREQVEEGEVLVLVIRGEVWNVTEDNRLVPDIRVGLFDANNRELHYWTFVVFDRELPSGAKTAFESRLANPPAAAINLRVNFAAEAPSSPDPSNLDEALERIKELEGELEQHFIYKIQLPPTIELPIKLPATE